MDKVRHVGEPVAVVLAVDPHVAEEALQHIVAEYDELIRKVKLLAVTGQLEFGDQFFGRVGNHL